MADLNPIEHARGATQSFIWNKELINPSPDLETFIHDGQSCIMSASSEGSHWNTPEVWQVHQELPRQGREAHPPQGRSELSPRFHSRLLPDREEDKTGRLSSGGGASSAVQWRAVCHPSSRVAAEPRSLRVCRALVPLSFVAAWMRPRPRSRFCRTPRPTARQKRGPGGPRVPAAPPAHVCPNPPPAQPVKRFAKALADFIASRTRRR